VGRTTSLFVRRGLTIVVGLLNEPTANVSPVFLFNRDGILFSPHQWYLLGLGPAWLGQQGDGPSRLESLFFLALADLSLRRPLFTLRKPIYLRQQQFFFSPSGRSCGAGTHVYTQGSEVIGFKERLS